MLQQAGFLGPGALICSMLIMAIGDGFAAHEIDREQQLRSYVRAASSGLVDAPRAALVKIRDNNKRLLALTYYLRAGPSLGARWSWTREQIEAYARSEEAREAHREVAKVAAQFAKENAPFTLYVNMQVRSLEEQLERWEEGRSVAAAAKEIHKAASMELLQASYPAIPNDGAAHRFVKFLSQWRASQAPALASPGLSPHGHGRAFDFQVRNGKGHLVASADTAMISVWEQQGWEAKLAKAVQAASNKFVGPLRAPREPWHYEYRPTR